MVVQGLSQFLRSNDVGRVKKFAVAADQAEDAATPMVVCDGRSLAHIVALLRPRAPLITPEVVDQALREFVQRMQACNFRLLFAFDAAVESMCAWSPALPDPEAASSLNCQAAMAWDGGDPAAAAATASPVASESAQPADAARGDVTAAVWPQCVAQAKATVEALGVECTASSHEFAAAPIAGFARARGALAVLSSDPAFCIMRGVKYMPTWGLDLHHARSIHARVIKRRHVAAALGVQSDQLPLLAALAGTDLTADLLRKQGVWDTLGLPMRWDPEARRNVPELEQVARFVQQRGASLVDRPFFAREHRLGEQRMLAMWRASLSSLQRKPTVEAAAEGEARPLPPLGACPRIADWEEYSAWVRAYVEHEVAQGRMSTWFRHLVATGEAWPAQCMRGVGAPPGALAELAARTAPVRVHMYALCGLPRVMEPLLEQSGGVNALKAACMMPEETSLPAMRDEWTAAQRWRHVLALCTLRSGGAGVRALIDSLLDAALAQWQQQPRAGLRRLAMLATLQLWSACVVDAAPRQASGSGTHRDGSSAARGAAVDPQQSSGAAAALQFAPFEVLALLVAIAAAVGTAEQHDGNEQRREGGARAAASAATGTTPATASAAATAPGSASEAATATAAASASATGGAARTAGAAHPVEPNDLLASRSLWVFQCFDYCQSLVAQLMSLLALGEYPAPLQVLDFELLQHDLCSGCSWMPALARSHLAFRREVKQPFMAAALGATWFSLCTCCDRCMRRKRWRLGVSWSSCGAASVRCQVPIPLATISRRLALALMAFPGPTAQPIGCPSSR